MLRSPSDDDARRSLPRALWGVLLRWEQLVEKLVRQRVRVFGHIRAIQQSCDDLTQGPWATSGIGLGATGAPSLTHSPIGALSLMRQIFFAGAVVFLGWNMCNLQQSSG